VIPALGQGMVSCVPPAEVVEAVQSVLAEASAGLELHRHGPLARRRASVMISPSNPSGVVIPAAPLAIALDRLVAGLTQLLG
jgi:hypothetical protein